MRHQFQVRPAERGREQRIPSKQHKGVLDFGGKSWGVRCLGRSRGNGLAGNIFDGFAGSRIDTEEGPTRSLYIF